MKAELFFTSLGKLPLIVFYFATIFILGFYLYFRFYKKQELTSKRVLNYTVWVLIGFRAIYSLVLSALQYYTWKKDTGGIGQYFLPPSRSIGYFLQYSWTHFFIGAVLSVGTAFIFYFILKAIKKHRAEIFEEGELELGLICALIVGWPSIILFVMLSFLMLLIVSAVKQVFFKDQFATITLPLLISLPIIFIFGQKLIQILHLEALIM